MYSQDFQSHLNDEGDHLVYKRGSPSRPKVVPSAVRDEGPFFRFKCVAVISAGAEEGAGSAGGQVEVAHPTAKLLIASGEVYAPDFPKSPNIQFYF